MSDPQSVKGWDENNSRTFLDYGRYFVPERERQIGIIGALIPPAPEGALLVELCSGEGLLSRALLERFPACRLLALDGSAEMRERTHATCRAAADRLTVAAFDLAGHDWRAFAEPPHAIVSSLAIHHLDGDGKRALFRDMAAALAGGGVLIIADIVRPPDARGLAVAAQQWDEIVRARALALDGDLGPSPNSSGSAGTTSATPTAIRSTSRRRWPNTWRGSRRPASPASTRIGCWRGTPSSARGSPDLAVADGEVSVC